MEPVYPADANRELISESVDADGFTVRKFKVSKRGMEAEMVVRTKHPEPMPAKDAKDKKKKDPAYPLDADRTLISETTDNDGFTVRKFRIKKNDQETTLVIKSKTPDFGKKRKADDTVRSSKRTKKAARTRVLILGAAGRDFHNFNCVYRSDPTFEVVAFTQTQIPNIEDRRYPAALAGDLYPDGIPMYPEQRLQELIRELQVDVCVMAYSDLSYNYVMSKCSLVHAAGADFQLLGPDKTMLRSKKPVIAICATRTGCGKSQTSRKIYKQLSERGYKVVAIRHPMPYDADIGFQTCQRFATYEDLERNRCTIEEREEYEPYVERGMIIYAGVDYAKVLAEAEAEADVIMWDGGNNDWAFIKPDLYLTVADPHRVGDESRYYPGETNVRLADYVVISKEDTAPASAVAELVGNIAKINPSARVVHADSTLSLERAEGVRGKRALVIDDGPTITHGGVPVGAGWYAARNAGAIIIDPRKSAVGSIKATFEKYPHVEQVLPAMGYGTKQTEELFATIEAADCDVVVDGSPVDLAKIFARVGTVSKPVHRVGYELAEKGLPNIDSILDEFESGAAMKEKGPKK